MPLTTDPNDPRLKKYVGPEGSPAPQNEVYLVLSEEERKKGFVRPLRNQYKHVGSPGPMYPTRELNGGEKERYQGYNYVYFEQYPEEKDAVFGRFWTQSQVDAIGKGCGTVTKMTAEIAETYARNPKFYGATYCMGCQRHAPVEEFVWMDDGTTTTDRVGS